MVKRGQAVPGARVVVKDMLRKSIFTWEPPQPNKFPVLKGAADAFGGGWEVSAGDVLEILDPVSKITSGEWSVSSRNGCWYKDSIQVVPVRIISHLNETLPVFHDGFAYWQDIYRGTDLIFSPPNCSVETNCPIETNGKDRND